MYPVKNDCNNISVLTLVTPLKVYFETLIPEELTKYSYMPFAPYYHGSKATHYVKHPAKVKQLPDTFINTFMALNLLPE